ncbi:MAG: hypothetical protein JSR44_02415 [Spirochaetes bacterium]|nr:hypothetical protein [Spirochaetota bacterium]
MPRTLILQDWFAEDDLLNPSLFALIELYPNADLGFLKNFANALPVELRDRRVEFYAARLTRKGLDNLDALIAAEALIPWQEYDLVISNTRGYIKHLRREPNAATRFVVYQHDILPFLWRVAVDTLNDAETLELLKEQELDLEYARGADLTIAANYALKNTLSAMLRTDVALAYPLVDSDIFFSDDAVEREYFLATESVDLSRLIHLFSCLTDKLVVLGDKRPDKFLRELNPDNIFYTGQLTLADQTYYLAGAHALLCGETHAISHLPLAALKMGVQVVAHPSQGMTELLADGECGVELETASNDELLAHIRRYRKHKEKRTKIATAVDWLNKEYFLRRMRKALL